MDIPDIQIILDGDAIYGEILRNNGIKSVTTIYEGNEKYKIIKPDEYIKGKLENILKTTQYNVEPDHGIITAKLRTDPIIAISYDERENTIKYNRYGLPVVESLFRDPFNTNKELDRILGFKWQ